MADAPRRLDLLESQLRVLVELASERDEVGAERVGEGGVGGGGRVGEHRGGRLGQMIES
jgi:hypothetical protein